jgi:hypothetical protein
MATEAHLKITDGFWGLLARGATFRHGTQQRPTLDLVDESIGAAARGQPQRAGSSGASWNRTSDLVLIRDAL